MFVCFMQISSRYVSLVNLFRKKKQTKKAQLDDGMMLQ